MRRLPLSRNYVDANPEVHVVDSSALFEGHAAAWLQNAAFSAIDFVLSRETQLQNPGRDCITSKFQGCFIALILPATVLNCFLGAYYLAGGLYRPQAAKKVAKPMGVVICRKAARETHSLCLHDKSDLRVAPHECR